MPESFFAVKKELEARTRTDDFLEIAEYEAICRQHALAKQSDQRQLLRFLHDLGSVLNFFGP